MQLTELRTDARYIISPQLTSADYADVDLDRNLNRWYRTGLGWIVAIGGQWQIEGDLMYRDFKINTTLYELPPNVIRILKGEAMYNVGGSFVPITFKDPSRDQNEVEGNSSRITDDVTKPTADYIGNYLEIKPAPTETVQNGLKIWAQFDIVKLDANNNVPNFVEPVQRLLSIGAAYDYAVAEEMYKKADELKKIIYGDPSKSEDKGLKGLIESLYSVRVGTQRDRLTASRRTSYR